MELTQSPGSKPLQASVVVSSFLSAALPFMACLPGQAILMAGIASMACIASCQIVGQS
jgi:hypothetical protein